MEYNEEYIQGLLFEKIAGTISEQDNVIAENAITQYPEVRIFWESLIAKMDVGQGKVFLSNLDTQKAWGKAQEKIHKKDRPVGRIMRWTTIGVAAMLMLVLPFIWFFTRQNSYSSLENMGAREVYLKTSDGNDINLSPSNTIQLGQAQIQTNERGLVYTAPQEEEGRWVTLVVPNTKDYQIKLSDGSEVWMNAGSTLRFPLHFGTQSREIFLTGEAFFKVTKNIKQEFIVHTSYASVHVHGTSFNVNSYDQSHFAVSLVTGSVSAKKDGQTLLLRPGLEGVIEQNTFRSREFEGAEVLSWMDGAYFFHNKSLSEIAPVLNRWFDVQIEYKDQSLSKQTFTGAIYKDQSLQEALENMELSSGVQADLKNKVVTFR
jgi:transmembrane sensor